MLTKPLLTKFKFLKYISDFKSPRTLNHQQELICITISITPILEVKNFLIIYAILFSCDLLVKRKKWKPYDHLILMANKVIDFIYKTSSVFTKYFIAISIVYFTASIMSRDFKKVLNNTC